MKIKLDLASDTDSNVFLRALWAEFRQTFGKCAWQYTPYKEGRRNRIHFGFADIGLGDGKALAISISYKRKGVISNIYFEAFWGEMDESLMRELPRVVDRAFARREELSNYYLQVSVSSRHGAVAPYTGCCFDLQPVGRKGKTNTLTLRIQGFDKEDARTEMQKTLFGVLDFLAVCTNSAFLLDSSHTRRKGKPELREEVFFVEFDWIDGHPRVDNCLVLWKSQKAFIDRIVTGEIELDHPFLRASRHFHAAQKLWYEGTKVADSTMELVYVLYVSALEAVSKLYPLKSVVCEKCGQRVYSIRQRVRWLAREHGGECIERLIDDYYSTRSGYLHEGVPLSDASYIGVSIPQLDPSSASGCRMQTPPSPINLREYVGFILRKIFLAELAKTA